jgi:radical SAM superfamily enzyme YgiQ (UPF0313 family)
MMYPDGLKLALVFPRVNCRSSDPPLGLASLCGFLRRHCPGVDVRIFDSSFDRSYSRILDEIGRFSPAIAGIFIDTVMFANAAGLIASFRYLGIPVIIAGGPHASMLPESLEREADAVFIGEAERSLAHYLNAFGTDAVACTPSAWITRDGRTIRNNAPALLPEEDLPTPDRGSLDMERYARCFHYLDSVGTRIRGTTMMASRGCPYHCSYCQPTVDRMFGKSLRYRSVGSVIEELQRLAADYRLSGFFFHDDTFFANLAWISAFVDQLRKTKLAIVWGCNSRVDSLDKDIIIRARESGLRVIHLGIESVVDRIVNGMYRKRLPLEKISRWIDWLAANRINALGFFMIGGPSETEEEIRKTIRFARSSRLAEATFSITTPIPGTELHEFIKNSAGYLLSDEYRDYNYYSRRAFEGNNVPMKKLHRMQLRALVGFYLAPRRLRYILRHLFSIQGIRKLLVKMQRYV